MDTIWNSFCSNYPWNWFLGLIGKARGHLGSSIRSFSSEGIFSASQRGVAEWWSFCLDLLLFHWFILTELPVQISPLPQGPGDYLLGPLPIDVPGVIESSGWDKSFCVAQWIAFHQGPVWVIKKAFAVPYIIPSQMDVFTQLFACSWIFIAGGRPRKLQSVHIVFEPRVRIAIASAVPRIRYFGSLDCSPSSLCKRRRACAAFSARLFYVTCEINALLSELLVSLFN